jgi:hypothetical protein
MSEKESELPLTSPIVKKTGIRKVVTPGPATDKYDLDEELREPVASPDRMSG